MRSIRIPRRSWNDSESVDTFTIINENLRKAGVTDFVEVVRAKSGDAAKAWRETIDLIFIDGDHSYEGVKADWEAFCRISTSSALSPFMTRYGICGRIRS